MQRLLQRVVMLISLTFVIACEPANNSQVLPETGSGLSISEILGGDNVEGFLRAEQARSFQFPIDHGLHAGFRNEWWYLTGNLETGEGRRFGYQLTFFNVSLVPDNSQEMTESAWHGDRIWMAHVALTDVEGNQHIALERFSRENPGLAGAQLEPFKVWLENWSLQASENADFPWQVHIKDEAFSLDLQIEPEKNLVLQGVEGLSQKSPDPGNASYYYSFTRLKTEGALSLDNEVLQLSGASWLDREWSSSALADDQTGWDWFSLQFDDGQELMYYQLRDAVGQSHLNSQGNWTDNQAQQTLIERDAIILEERQHWQSPAGVIYTTQWLMTYEGQEWIVQSVLDQQLMSLSIEYWEGAVDVFSASTMEKVGQGYLEMLRE